MRYNLRWKSNEILYQFKVVYAFNMHADVHDLRPIPLTRNGLNIGGGNPLSIILPFLQKKFSACHPLPSKMIVFDSQQKEFLPLVSKMFRLDIFMDFISRTTVVLRS